MSKLRYFISLLFIGVALVSQAQVQKGYVKTLGRPNKPGVALSGVTVRARGAHNAVLSNAQGIFSMQLVGKKQGDAYILQQVQKQGYELNEQGVIGRPYAYSSTVPLHIVMVSRSQLQTEKQRIEDHAYQTAEKTYKEKLDLLEKQHAERRISAEQYRTGIQELQQKFDKYQSLIDGLSEHYARVDYDELDEKEREINVCIENGDLNKAEELLQELDIEKRLAEIEQRIKLGKRLMAEAEEDMARILKQQEKDAKYLYDLYAIALGRFDNEKARFYIETRAALDPDNVRWQIDAGEFLFENLNLFDAALSYFERGMESSASESLERAECLNDIAMLNVVKGNFQRAHQLLQQSLELRQRLVEEDSAPMATIYNNYAATYLAEGKVDDALSYHQKSLAIRRQVYGENSAKVAFSYYNIGAVLIAKKDFDGAGEFFAKGLAIADRINEKMPASQLLKLYDGMGGALAGKADAEMKPLPHQVIEYRDKSLDYCLKIYGSKNIVTAGVYHNVGTAYAYTDIYQIAYQDTVSVMDTKNLQQGLEYLVKSLDIKKELIPNNQRVIKETEAITRLIAKNYCILGFRNFEKGDYQRMLTYLQQAKEVFEIASEPEDDSLIQTINSALSQLKQIQK